MLEQNVIYRHFIPHHFKPLICLFYCYTDCFSLDHFGCEFCIRHNENSFNHCNNKKEIKTILPRLVSTVGLLGRYKCWPSHVLSLLMNDNRKFVKLSLPFVTAIAVWGMGYSCRHNSSIPIQSEPILPKHSKHNTA